MPTADELIKQNTQVGVPASADTAGSNVVNGAYKTARTDAINQMYDAQRAAREAELKSAYDQSMTGYQAAQEKIAPQYQQQANELARQNEQNRQNFMRQAAASGINTGVSAQESLARQGQYLGSMGRLRQSEAEAQKDLELKRSQLLASYQSQVASALAENDYQRAGALLDEYNNGYQRDLRNAEIMANYGDFSGYRELYGEDRANNMYDLWIAQNPDLAYNSGRITRDQYFVITGREPVSWAATGGLSVRDLVDGRIPAGRAPAPAPTVGGPSDDWVWREAIGWGTYNPLIDN